MSVVAPVSWLCGVLRHRRQLDSPVSWLCGVLDTAGSLTPHCRKRHFTSTANIILKLFFCFQGQRGSALHPRFLLYVQNWQHTGFSNPRCCDRNQVCYTNELLYTHPNNFVILNRYITSFRKLWNILHSLSISVCWHWNKCFLFIIC